MHLPNPTTLLFFLATFILSVLATTGPYAYDRRADLSARDAESMLGLYPRRFAKDGDHYHRRDIYARDT